MPPPSGITFNPEAIAIALFNLLQTSSFSFSTYDRRGKIWTDVPPTNQPYLALIQRGMTGVQDTALGLEKWTLHFIVLVYIRSDADPVTIPATLINTIIKAIAEVINSNPIGQLQRLGGLVNNCWISGDISIDTGILDQQCAIVIPVSAQTGL